MRIPKRHVDESLLQKSLTFSTNFCQKQFPTSMIVKKIKCIVKSTPSQTRVSQAWTIFKVFPFYEQGRENGRDEGATTSSNQEIMALNQQYQIQLHNCATILKIIRQTVLQWWPTQILLTKIRNTSTQSRKTSFKHQKHRKYYIYMLSLIR